MCPPCFKGLRIRPRAAREPLEQLEPQRFGALIHVISVAPAEWGRMNDYNIGRQKKSHERTWRDGRILPGALYFGRC